MPFPRNHGFVGREEDLAHLHTALQGAETVGIRPAGLTGQGGIGKTQLAVEYCYRHFHDQDDYPGGVFWVNAAEEWRQGFAALGRRVEPDCAERPTEQQIQAAARYLRGHPDALLVLDNVADPARLLRPVIPELIPADLPGPVLFTTRRRDLGRFQPVEVSVLPPQPALLLLLSHPSRADVRQPHHPEHATAQEICRILGGLPLALEIAAAHLGKRPTQPVAAYRDALLNRGALAVVDDRRGGVRDEDLGTRHAAAVAATLAEQWDLVQSEDARLLLRIAGQLPEAAQIPTARLGLLAAISDEDDGFFGSPLVAALAELADISLIEVLTDVDIRLHPLVREFAVELTTNDEAAELRQTCAARIVRAYSDAKTLEHNYVRRGMVALEFDVRAALILAPFSVATTRDSLSRLLRLLERVSSEMNEWNLGYTPSQFAQQLWIRADWLDLTDLGVSAKGRLICGGANYIALKWTTSQSHPFLIRTLGHEHDVRSVAVTPDNRLVVSGSGRSVYLWDLVNGKKVAALIGHEDDVSCVIVSPDGRRVLSSSWDKTVRVWDIESGRSVATLTGHEGWISSVAITPNGLQAVTASHDLTVRVWDLESGESIRIMTGHEAPVMSVAVTPDGRWVVSADAEEGIGGVIRVWDIDSGRTVLTLTGHENGVSSVAITPDGSRVVSASWDDTVRIWELESGEWLATLHGHTDWVESVSVTSDGRYVVSASDDRTVRVWDLETFRSEATLVGHEHTVVSVVVTSDGQRVISASGDDTVRIWDPATRISSNSENQELAGRSKRNKGAVLSVVVTPDGRRMLSVSTHGPVRMWDLVTGKIIANLRNHEMRVGSISVTSDGRFAVLALYNGKVQLWDFYSNDLNAKPLEYDEFDYLSLDETDIGGFAQTVLRIGNSGWDRLGSRNHAVLEATHLTSDGMQIASVIRQFLHGRGLWVWDLENKRCVSLPLSHEQPVISVAVTLDGSRAVSASHDGTLCVWNLENGKKLMTLTGHPPAWNTVVAVTLDGRRVLSSTRDHAVCVWDLKTGEIVMTLAGHQAKVTSIVVTPDGRKVVSGSYDRTIRVWDLDGGDQLAAIVLDGKITTVNITPNGSTIVAGDILGSVYCLDYVQYVTSKERRKYIV